jgi:hypothetical protein
MTHLLALQWGSRCAIDFGQQKTRRAGFLRRARRALIQDRCADLGRRRTLRAHHGRDVCRDCRRDHARGARYNRRRRFQHRSNNSAHNRLGNYDGMNFVSPTFACILFALTVKWIAAPLGASSGLQRDPKRLSAADSRPTRPYARTGGSTRCKRRARPARYISRGLATGRAEAARDRD